MKAKYNLYSIIILLFAWVILSLNIYAVTQNRFGSSAGIFLIIGIILQGMLMSLWSSCIIREENTIVSFANIIITALLCFAGYLYRETISIASMTGFFNQWMYRNGVYLLLWLGGCVVVFLYKVYDLRKHKGNTEMKQLNHPIIVTILPFIFLLLAGQLLSTQNHAGNIREVMIAIFCALCIFWHMAIVNLPKKQTMLIAGVVLLGSILYLVLQASMHIFASSMFMDTILICILFYMGAAAGSILLSSISYKKEESEKITTYI